MITFVVFLIAVVALIGVGIAWHDIYLLQQQVKVLTEIANRQVRDPDQLRRDLAEWDFSQRATANQESM